MPVSGLGMKLRRIAWGIGLDIHQPSRMLAGGVRRVPRLGPLNNGNRAVPQNFKIDVNVCTSFIGLPYSGDSWNPLTETLREYEMDSQLKYEQSTLARTHENFHPKNLQELFFGMSSLGSVPPLNSMAVDRRLYRYIWNIGPATLQEDGSPRAPSLSYYFGPLSLAHGEREFDRLLATYEALKSYGYRPDTFGAVTGYFLGDNDNYRFVVGSGNHRVAALSVLGIDSFEARLHSHPAVVHRDHLDSWTTAKGGPFPPGTASELFNLFLYDDGLTRRKELRMNFGEQ